MVASPKTVNLLRRTIGALADIAAAAAGRRLVIGEGTARITARMTGLEIEPSEVLDVMDPTAVDADLADTLRIPGSIGDLVAPWREGARAAARATGKLSRSMVAAGSGRYELAAGLRLRLEEVRGPDWVATHMEVRTGPLRLAAGPQPELRCVGIEVVATVDSDDLARQLRHLPLSSVRIENGSLLVRPSGRLSPLTFGVVPTLRDRRVALEGRSVAWRTVCLPIPAPLARRWTRWLDPPEWLEIDGLTVGEATAEARGRVDRWAHPISTETVQQLAAAAQRRGQDLVLPRWPAPTG